MNCFARHARIPNIEIPLQVEVLRIRPFPYKLNSLNEDPVDTCNIFQYFPSKSCFLLFSFDGGIPEVFASCSSRFLDRYLLLISTYCESHASTLSHCHTPSILHSFLIFQEDQICFSSPTTALTLTHRCRRSLKFICMREDNTLRVCSEAPQYLPKWGKHGGGRRPTERREMLCKPTHNMEGEESDCRYAGGRARRGDCVACQQGSPKRAREGERASGQDCKPYTVGLAERMASERQAGLTADG